MAAPALALVALAALAALVTLAAFALGAFVAFGVLAPCRSAGVESPESPNEPRGKVMRPLWPLFSLADSNKPQRLDVNPSGHAPKPWSCYGAALLDCITWPSRSFGSLIWVTQSGLLTSHNPDKANSNKPKGLGSGTRAPAEPEASVITETMLNVSAGTTMKPVTMPNPE